MTTHRLLSNATDSPSRSTPAGLLAEEALGVSSVTMFVVGVGTLGARRKVAIHES